MSDDDLTVSYSSDQPNPTSGTTVGRFILGPELGRGAFGVVHRAYDPTLGREVAVKLPTAADAPTALVERFIREARAAAGLRHPNVVTVYDVGSDSGRPFIAMELIDGPTLADRLTTRPTHRQAAEWIRALALALHHAHVAGILHRDVKPGNVLLDEGGRVRLTDFGISKLTPGSPTADVSAPAVTQDGTIMGSPGYMSPEQARGEVSAIGPATDQYSLGVVLYEMLTGRRPFLGSGGEVMRQAADPLAVPPSPREVAAEVPVELEAVVLKALSKDPAGRYPTAADLAVDLQRWLKGDRVTAPLRLRGEAVRVCPDCVLPTNGFWPQCRLCGRELEDVPITDSADLPPPRPKENPRVDLPEGASAAQLQAVVTGLGMIQTRVSFTLWAVGLLVFTGVAAYLLGDTKNGVRYLPMIAGGIALVLLAVGQLLELVGLGFCLRIPTGSGGRTATAVAFGSDLFLDHRGHRGFRCRMTAAVAFGCQLMAPLCSGYGGYLFSGPGRDEIIPIRFAKEPEPITERSQYPRGPRRKIGMTKYQPASGPAVWVVCLAAGGLLGAAGWVASILLLDDLASYLELRYAEGQAIPILAMGAAVAFGPSLLLFLAGYIFLPRALFWFAVLVAIVAVAVLIVLLLKWHEALEILGDDLRQRLGRPMASRSAQTS